MSVSALAAPAGGHSAADVLAAVLDAGTFRSWDAPADRTGAPARYLEQLARAEVRAGADEAVLTGEGLLAGRRVAVVVSEFAFLAGSVGTAAAARIVAAVERATAERLPLLAAPASGGTRMQEGTGAFVTMAGIVAALSAHRAAHLPYLVHLRHPTTGGVLASWGSLGHVTTAEPGALVGLLGPRVQEALTGAALPAGVQRAENLRRHGVVDAVVPLHRLRATAARALDVLCAPVAGHPCAGRPGAAAPGRHLAAVGTRAPVAPVAA
ncbi:acetyl-CoA carboxylase carboxyltransferase subunit beta, partial [Kineococcus glutinatus]|uniref:acetyl-CoA carboxylase carboxyltransferase subunit beta n=1 Tax=Kineococcus glutinatus TaxID=1070872 RepID=UPI0031F0E70D